MLDSDHEWSVAEPPGLLILGGHSRAISHLIKHLLELNVGATCGAIPNRVEHLGVLALFIEHLWRFSLCISCISQRLLVSINHDKSLN